MAAHTPTLLLILDGWGQAPAGEGNAVSLARTPNLDRITAEYPCSRLACSGRAVGLPEGFMGNSEVGHMNIGAGRVVYQDMTRIDMALEDGSLLENPVLNQLIDAAEEQDGRLHLMGLLSDGGVHSHINHLFALLSLAKKRDIEVFVHVFLDGRDTSPTSGAGYVKQLADWMRDNGTGEIATISGRYWAMDRDKRWDRNKLAYDALVMGQGAENQYPFDPVQAVKAAYLRDETDEFVKPLVMRTSDGSPVGSIRTGDAVFFYNFRADRAKQITRAFIEKDFSEFERFMPPVLSGYATMTEYDSHFGVPVAFPPVEVVDTLGQTVSGLGLKQLRVAETEKYAHVTYFLNCGREEPFPGEDREMIPSPKEVATYDLKPEMSCPKVTELLLEKWNSGEYDLIVCNLANLDMVGHTGIIEAAIKACEVVDSSVGRILEAVLARGGRMFLTADHGNAEEMLDPEGNPQTAHSTNPVALVYAAQDASEMALADGRLGDIAPTILTTWGLDQPEAMTGENLLGKKGEE